jgi:predicted RND superfamily exporter protein
MFKRLLLTGLEYQLTTISVLLIITVITAMGLNRLSIDTGLDSLIPANDPMRLVYERISDEFGTDNRTIIYIRDTNLWTPEKLEALEKLHYELGKLDYVTRVDDLFSLHTIRGEDGKVDSRPLMPEAPATLELAQQIRQDALDNPLIVDNFISVDATVTAIIVSIREARNDNDFNFRVNDDLNNLVAGIQPLFDEVVQVGSPRINTELKTSLAADFKLLGPLSALILVLSIVAFLRSTTAALIPIITSALSIIWTFGLMGWLGLPVNILSVMLPSLIIVIGSTEDTHLIASYFHSMTKTESSASSRERRRIASRMMMNHMGLPLVLTISTTLLGFASNIFNSIGLIQDFAISSTMAILFNGLITLLLVPILLERFGPLKNSIYQQDGHMSGVASLVSSAFSFSQSRFPRMILVITGVLCVFFVYAASKLHVTNDPLSYFPEHRPLIQDAKLIHQDLSGIKLFFITLETDREKSFQHPRNIQKLADIQGFIRKQGAFDRSISLADHLAFVNREFRQGEEKLDLPESRELVSQFLLFFHRSDLESYISHDMSKANIIVRHNIHDSHTLNRYVEELRQAIPAIVGNEMKASIVSENLMVNQAAESLMIAQVKSLVILLFVIFLIMSAMYTSFKGGVISLVPAVIPIVLMFGTMGLLDIPLNPGTAMVAVIAIGIAIDGTIHLLSRYNELCRRTDNYIEAVSITVHEESTPLVTASLSLAFGFGILLLSNFTVVAQFGALAAATMLFSIYANLLITPLIMTHVRLVGLHQILAISVDKVVLENSPLFADMSNYQRRKAILISELNEFDAGEKLIVQDTSGRNMYLLLSGEVDVIRHNPDEDLHLATLKPGQVFGEIGFIKETHRTADVQARTAVSVLRFDYDKLKKDLKLFPNIIAKLNFNISCILGERLADVVESMGHANKQEK